MNDLAGIVERDAAGPATVRWSHEYEVAVADRRALLALLRETHEALTTADDIIHANVGEDTCRHDEYVDECEEPDGCPDRSRRETITELLARLAALGETR